MHKSPTSTTFVEKQELIIKHFSELTSSQAIYLAIMDLGRKLKPFQDQWKTRENLVTGCQSQMYLRTEYQRGCLYFYAYSDALISAGLAALLISVYDGESPETVLMCEPTFLQHLGIHASLTPGRSNGLASLQLKMKQEALAHLAHV